MAVGGRWNVHPTTRGNIRVSKAQYYLCGVKYPHMYISYARKHLQCAKRLGGFFLHFFNLEKVNKVPVVIQEKVFFCVL